MYRIFDVFIAFRALPHGRCEVDRLIVYEKKLVYLVADFRDEVEKAGLLFLGFHGQSLLRGCHASI